MDTLSNTHPANTGDTANSAATEPEGVPFIEATRQERTDYVPSPDATQYDGPRDASGDPFGSCWRRWERSRKGIFARADLDILEAPNDVLPLLESATKALVELVNTPPDYGSPNPDFGRFGFGSYSQTAKETRAAFRLCRLALSFLEADYRACEEEEMTHLRGQLFAFEKMHGARALGEEVAA
jgi:hypothetical protein